MANLQERKSFLFGTLQERNSCQSLKTQSREGNTEMHTMEMHEGMGKRQICTEMKMTIHLSWIAICCLSHWRFYFPPSKTCLGYYKHIRSLLKHTGFLCSEGHEDLNIWYLLLKMFLLPHENAFSLHMDNICRFLQI